MVARKLELPCRLVHDQRLAVVGVQSTGWGRKRVNSSTGDWQDIAPSFRRCVFNWLDDVIDYYAWFATPVFYDPH